MTDSESRIQNLENTVHNIDKRQETFEVYTKQRQDSFEEFARENIKYMKEAIVNTNARMDRLESKMDNISNQLHNFIIAGTVGVAAIVVTILASK